MPYIGRSSNFGVRTRFLYTATASQTSFTGADTQNLTLSYSDSNFIDVHQNGVLLKVVDDYTATTGTSVVLATGATANDVIEITVYDVFSIANHIKKTGDAMAGTLTNIDIDGTELVLDADGDTSITADTDDQIDIKIAGADKLKIDGSSHLVTLTAGTSNLVLGVNAGNSIASGGNYNVCIGDEAGTALTTGDYNVAVGFEALKTEDANGKNIAIGYQALKVLDVGSDGKNTAIGYQAGVSMSTGIVNTLIGHQAGDALTTGNNNVAIGHEALGAEIQGDQNVAVGVGALQSQSNSSDVNALNTAVGYNAGLAVTTGTQNTLIGGLAGDAITDADGNVAVGYASLTSNVLGSDSVAIGKNALNAQNPSSATAMYNVAIGKNAGESVTTGVENVFVGALSGDAVLAAGSNTAVGYLSLSSETGGQNNVAIGRSALQSQVNSSGNIYNTAVGSQAGASVTTGTKNTFIGANAGNLVTNTTENTFVGYLCGDAVTTNPGSTAIGSQAFSEQGGDYNTAVGRKALNACTSNGDRNVAIGEVALFSVGDGSGNSGLGQAAGYAITTGANNICIGKDSGRTGSPGGNITSGSNEIGLGDESIASFSCQVSLTATSDERDKTDFKDLDLGLDFVKALKPVTYVWDKRTNYVDKTDPDWRKTLDLDKITSDGSKKDDDLQVGFKAQDVIALEEASGYKLSDKTNLTATVTNDGKQYGLSYERFVPMLVKAVQELSAKNDALEARIKKLEVTLMPRSTINGTAIDLDGKEMILDADQDTTLTVDTDDRVDIKVAGSDKVHVTSTGLGIGTTSNDGSLHVKGISDHGQIILEAGGTSGSDNNTFMQFHNGGGTQIAQIAVEEGASNEGQIIFKTGGTTTAMTIDKDGHITQPLQSAFSAHKNGTDQTNIAGSASEVTVTWSHERFDQNADFDLTNNRFVAPVTGKYQLNLIMRLENIDSASDYYVIRITTSNRAYEHLIDPDFGQDNVYHPVQIAVLADMDASDTATVFISQQGSTAQTDIDGNNGYTSFSGYLVC
jgi:hypothetical protein